MNKKGAKNFFVNVFTVFFVGFFVFSFFTNSAFAIEDRPKSINIQKVDETSNSVTVEVTIVNPEADPSPGYLGCDVILKIKKSTDTDFVSSPEFIDSVKCNSDPKATVKIKNLEPGTTYNIQPIYEEEVGLFLPDYWIFEEVPTLTITTPSGEGSGGEYEFELISSGSAYTEQYKGSELSLVQLDSEAEKVDKAGGIFNLKLNSQLLGEWPSGHYYADWSVLDDADESKNTFIGVVYDKSGNKVEETAYVGTDETGAIIKDNTHLPANVTLSFGELNFETEYTLRAYYKADDGGEGLGINALGYNDESYIEIESIEFKTLEKGKTTVLGTVGSETYETGGGPKSGIGKINCEANPATWDGCMVKWFYSLIYTPSQAVLRVSASLTDALLSFSISSVIYNASTFTQTGWQIIRDISNLFFIIILIYVAVGTIVGTQKVSIQKIITQLIVIALLINFSLFFTRVIVDASNILARVLYNTLTIEGQPEKPIVQGTGVDTEQKSLSRAVSSGLQFEKTISPEILSHPNVNLGYFFLTYIFGTILYLMAAWEFFLIGVMFLNRILEIWISMIFAPFAFISTIVPGWGKTFGKANWKPWLDNLLCWCFIAPIFLFFVMLINAFINSSFLDGLIIAKESGSINLLMFWAAAGLQFMIILGLLKQARKTAKSMGCETAINFSDYAAKWGKKIGFGAGAVALGVASGGAAAIGRNTLGRMGTNVAQSESLKLKSKQGGMSGWVARQQLNTANKLSKSTFDIRKTQAGEKLKGLGFQEKGIYGKATSMLGFNEKQSDGYKERLDKRKKKDVDFYKEMMIDKKAHDKMKGKYDSAFEEYVKKNGSAFGYKQGQNMKDFKKENADGYQKMQKNFNEARDNAMFGKYYEKYKKKNNLSALNEDQKKDALKNVRKDKLETVKGVFEKENGTNRQLEDINKDRLNAYAEVIEKRIGHVAEGVVKSAGNTAAGGAVANVAGGVSLAGAGAIVGLAGVPILEASAKSDAYRQAAEELRNMAEGEKKNREKREKNEGEISKKIEKEEKYQEKMLSLLTKWKESVDSYNRGVREEMKLKVDSLNINDSDLDDKLEKVMEMNDRKMAEHELKRDSLAEKARELKKRGKNLPEKDHEEFVSAVAQIKKLGKENDDIKNFTQNHRKSAERLDGLKEKESSIKKPEAPKETKVEEKK